MSLDPCHWNALTLTPSRSHCNYMIISKHRSAHFALLNSHGTFKVNYRIRLQHPAWHSQSSSTWPHWVPPSHIPSSPVRLTLRSLYDTSTPVEVSRTVLFVYLCSSLSHPRPLSLRTAQGQFKELHSGKHSLSPGQCCIISGWQWTIECEDWVWASSRGQHRPWSRK